MSKRRLPLTEIERKTWEEMAAEPGSIDLGNGSFYVKTVDREGNWVAISEYHKDSHDNLCGGWVPFNVESEYLTSGSPKWEVRSLDPLHLEPSLLCGCGHHGFIRNGRWESC